MNKNIYQIILVVLFACSIEFCLSGCDLITKGKFDCIDPPEEIKFSYDANQWSNLPDIQPILANKHNSWKLIIEDPSISYADQIIARGDDQIWILGKTLQLYSKKNKQLLRFFLNWKNHEDIPQYIYHTKDNSLWAIGWLIPSENRPLLSRFNDTTSQFENIIDNERLLLSSSGSVEDVQEDAIGRLWILISGTGIYAFDPHTNKAEFILPQVLEDGSRITSIEVDSEANLWLGTYSGSPQDNLIYFDTKTLQTTKIPLGANSQNPNTGMLIDNENRLWVSDYAFLNIGDPLWTEDYLGFNFIIRSPVFITQRKPFYDYYWHRPTILMQDSDGGIWYSSFGLVRLDPKNGEWCRILENSGLNNAIEEDPQGHFWLVEEGRLFEHN